MSIPKHIKINPHLISPFKRGRKKDFGKPPTTPGVYLFRDGKGRVVYVGKATNLRSRVGSYFSIRHPERSEGSRGRKDGILQSPRGSLRMTGGGGRPIDEMLHEVRRIDWITTDSVIEALILEANLIRKYMPQYNVKEKDDKSFLYVVITKEQWPKVMLMRGSELAQYRHPERLPAQAGSEEPALSLSKGSPESKDGILRSPRGSLRMTDGVMRVFGPYTNASAIRAALDLIRKWFPWGCMTRSTTKGKNEAPRKPCFDYHIGRCPGVCVGAITRREYMKNIRNVILMLEGKKVQVIKNVKLKMQNYAEAERFEEAEKLRRKLLALRHIRDVAVLTRGANNESLANLRISNSQIRKFESHSQFAPMTDEAINIWGRIEGYDISNISGTSAVGSMVVFENGEPCKSEYKRFRIKTVRGINDVGMMKEVLTRRFRHSERSEESRGSKDGILRSPRGSLRMTRIGWPLPDLLVIDGGWGQVNAAREVVDDWARTVLSQQRTVLASIPIVGIAKGFKRKQDRPVFDKDNPELARIVENYKELLLQVRDEAHRFAVAYHRKRMRKRLR